ncbi:tryptophan 2,3-dioxygenase family protein, partial [Streptomyces sp. NPDC048385]|uniref:tryptophan 2,3-dioxygenase family protein n=1 Tax=Streptomyces sp. NPDC048385 TaxID=3155145 RepID=UPI00341BB8E8
HPASDPSPRQPLPHPDRPRSLTVRPPAVVLGRWRTTHLLTVERLLGTKSGTAGTSGAAWLRRAAEHRFFPELWTVRARI